MYDAKEQTTASEYWPHGLRRLALGSLIFATANTFAAVPVEDSLLRAAAQLDTRTYSEAEEADLWSRAGQAVDSPSSDAPLQYQVQVLQQQVRELSGLVEEQAYLIRKLQQDQRQQYVDLDRRLMALNPNRPTPGPAPIPESDPISVPGSIQGPIQGPIQAPIQDAGQAPNQTASSQPLAQGASGPSGSSVGPTESVVALASQPAIAAVAPKPTNEREAYAQAIEWMRGKRFAESTQALESLIVDYPNGQFTPNAFYWLGELKLATGETEAARQNFVQVVRLYPDHQKVPDALYKLGVLYFQLGDASEARRYLQRVRSEFPQSTAGTLATRYLAEME